VYGDIGNTFWSLRSFAVDAAHALVTIVHVPDPISCQAERHRLPDEGPADQHLSTAEGDAPLVLDPPHLVTRSVLHRRQRHGERSRAGQIAGGGCGMVERFVGPAQIVDVPPGIKRALDLAEAPASSAGALRPRRPAGGESVLLCPASAGNTGARAAR